MVEAGWRFDMMKIAIGRPGSRLDELRGVVLVPNVAAITLRGSTARHVLAAARGLVFGARDPAIVPCRDLARRCRKKQHAEHIYRSSLHLSDYRLRPPSGPEARVVIRPRLVWEDSASIRKSKRRSNRPVWASGVRRSFRTCRKTRNNPSAWSLPWPDRTADT